VEEFWLDSMWPALCPLPLTAVKPNDPVSIRVIGIPRALCPLLGVVASALIADPRATECRFVLGPRALGVDQGRIDGNVQRAGAERDHDGNAQAEECKALVLDRPCAGQRLRSAS